MGDTESPLIITCDADEAEQVVRALRTLDLDVQASERRNLDGATASMWILALPATIQAMPRIVRALQPFFNRRKIRRIQFGDTMLEEVQPEDAAKLIEQIRSQGEKNG